MNLQNETGISLEPFTYHDAVYLPLEAVAEALTKVLGDNKVTLEIIKGANHGTSEFNTQENIEKVMAFLDKYLK